MADPNGGDDYLSDPMASMLYVLGGSTTGFQPLPISDSRSTVNPAREDILKLSADDIRSAISYVIPQGDSAQGVETQLARTPNGGAELQPQLPRRLAYQKPDPAPDLPRIARGGPDEARPGLPSRSSQSTDLRPRQHGHVVLLRPVHQPVPRRRQQRNPVGTLPALPLLHDTEHATHRHPDHQAPGHQPRAGKVGSRPLHRHALSHLGPRPLPQPRLRLRHRREQDPQPEQRQLPARAPRRGRHPPQARRRLGPAHLHPRPPGRRGADGALPAVPLRRRDHERAECSAGGLRSRRSGHGDGDGDPGAPEERAGDGRAEGGAQVCIRGGTGTAALRGVPLRVCVWCSADWSGRWAYREEILGRGMMLLLLVGVASSGIGSLALLWYGTA
ncbi:hypothetical protein MBM_01211 [Drepanopeziza brunnea f. sp. 'multigermtubi' MB_m1]|uniref:Uncharacterized protein n=1 Tax=Marssonina brunnea f. sp. multigermtubi (strain MB_m1) TaxID=1072389 RepID=K1Y5P4_MARBU|nr:uncharacterized protein MBM_01211 [Drepanopeziza brunnea f. sp. 'multigermtubi' MB_m1]EKD20529.1 hypothetical protein MBM_01211 [Drepanopeziza brunnea f. sp. 'multigermtubi' MB_m1]